MQYATHCGHIAATTSPETNAPPTTTVPMAGAPLRRNRLSRVDLQVFILAALLVILSCSLVFLIHYSLSARDMIQGLQDRVSSIYGHLEEQLDMDTFRTIETRDDEAQPAYQQLHDLLMNTKAATGVMYLYTAKPRADGSFIYVVDGLPRDAPDFRHPGDPIETEITADMRTALNSTPVLPDNILNTSWGPIFISYLPIHDGDEVIGVLGVEFDAAHQYNTYRLLRVGTPFIILAFCLAAAGISVLLFRRISNPSYRDASITDFLTGLKNRNAFDTDLHNLSAQGAAGVCIFSVDLDNLKRVNDTLGHPAGDSYIRTGANILRGILMPGGTLYRIGGDEYALIARGWDSLLLPDLLKQLEEGAKKANQLSSFSISLSVGCAAFDPALDGDLFATYHRADAQMYEQKRQHKAAAQT